MTYHYKYKHKVQLNNKQLVNVSFFLLTYRKLWINSGQDIHTRMALIAVHIKLPTSLQLCVCCKLHSCKLHQFIVGRRLTSRVFSLQ